MGLPIDAKTDWQAVCNAEALLCSSKTLRNAFRFVVSVLGENGINAPKVTLPPLNTIPRQWLEPEQIPPLIAAAVGTPSAFPVMLAMHSLRRSELLAVTWDDIDLAAGTIRVSGNACCLLAIKKPLGMAFGLLQRQAAAEAGQSVNAYILQAVKDRMQKENTNNH